MTELKLEEGLAFYYQHVKEFEQRNMPIEEQIAVAFEAGKVFGKYGQSNITIVYNDKK